MKKVGKLFSGILLREAQPQLGCFGAKFYSQYNFISLTDVRNASISTTPKGGSKTQSKTPNTTDPNQKLSAEAETARNFRAHFSNEEIKRVKTSLLNRKKTPITQGDIFLLHSFNPSTLPKQYFEQALTELQNLKRIISEGDFTLNVETCKLLIFWGSKIYNHEPKNLAALLNCVAPLFESELDAALQEKLAFNGLLIIYNSIYQNKGDIYGATDAIVQYLTKYLQSVEGDFDYFAQACLKKRLRAGTDEAFRLFSIVQFFSKTLQTPEYKTNADILKLAHLCFQHIEILIVASGEQVSPIIYKKLQDALYAIAMIDKQALDRENSGLVRIWLEWKTQSLHRSDLVDFYKACAFASVCRYSTKLEDAFIAFWTEASKYIVAHAQDFDENALGSLLYSVGKVGSISPKALKVISPYLTPEYFAELRGNRNYAKFYKNFMLFGIDSLLITKANLPRYFEDFNEIFNKYEAQGWPNEATDSFLQLGSSFARAGCYSWQIWKYLSNNFEKMVQTHNNSYQLYFILSHFQNFFEEIDDENTKKLARRLTTSHEEGQKIIQRNAMDYTSVIYTHTESTFVDWMQSRGFEVKKNYPSNASFSNG